jgi:IS5 family transposase
MAKSVSNHQEPVVVAVPVDPDHPLLKLKEILPWNQLYSIAHSAWRKNGKNVDHGKGRKWDLRLYVMIIVLKIILGLNSRQMEDNLTENAVTRMFIEYEDYPEPQIRDHSNIARAEESLGKEALQEINDVILRLAQKMGYADISSLSADTTVQEAAIGYPNEPGILRGVAQRCLRVFNKLKKKGIQVGENVINQARLIIDSAKNYHLFAKGNEEKEGLLSNMLEQVRSLQDQTFETIRSIKDAKNRTIVSAKNKLLEMQEVTSILVPQILQWLTTGVVAKGKILHPGITKARAIAKNKIGKKTEFGFKYLIARLGGGYLFGKLFYENPSEHSMPGEAVKEYKRIFGDDKAPEVFAYDRGADSDDTIEKLKEQGVAKPGIQPKGKRPWSVDDADQDLIKTLRAQIEAAIGTLKTEKYGFNRPGERKEPNLAATGIRAILSRNLNQLMRDICKRVVPG